MTKRNDHDAIVEIGVKLDVLTREVKEMKNNLINRVDNLESRVRKLEDDGNISRGDSRGISTSWKIVVTILTLVIAVLSYLAYMK